MAGGPQHICQGLVKMFSRVGGRRRKHKTQMKSDGWLIEDERWMPSNVVTAFIWGEWAGCVCVCVCACLHINKKHTFWVTYWKQKHILTLYSFRAKIWAPTYTDEGSILLHRCLAWDMYVIGCVCLSSVYNHPPFLCSDTRDPVSTLPSLISLPFSPLCSTLKSARRSIQCNTKAVNKYCK